MKWTKGKHSTGSAGTTFYLYDETTGLTTYVFLTFFKREGIWKLCSHPSRWEEIPKAEAKRILFNPNVFWMEHLL